MYDKEDDEVYRKEEYDIVEEEFSDDVVCFVYENCWDEV